MVDDRIAAKRTDRAPPWSTPSGGNAFSPHANGLVLGRSQEVPSKRQQKARMSMTEEVFGYCGCQKASAGHVSFHPPNGN